MTSRLSNTTRAERVQRGSARWIAASRLALAGLLLGGLTAPTAQAALEVSATTVASPARQADWLPTEWTVSNTDAFTRFGVTMTMEFPAGVNQLFDSQFSGDCPSSACETGETVTWVLGDIPANSALTFSWIPRVANAAADGSTISFVPTVSDSSLDEATTTLNVDIDGGSFYDLAVAESHDPATAGSQLTYKLTFGYLQDVAAVTNSTLRFTVPANATFVSASGGGSNAGGVVSWPLGFLSPGQSGEREVTVQLDGGLTAGQTLRGDAEIFSVAAPTDNAVATASTVVAATSGLQIVLEANPNPARPGELLNIDMTVRNTDPFTRFGVGVSAPWPQELAQYFETEFNGDCPSSACEPGEFVTFSLGDIPAGGAVTTKIPPRILAAALPGSIMTLDMTLADVSGLQARQSDSLRVDDGNLYDLAIAEDSDPAVAGATMNYQIRYALRADAGTVSNAVLRLPLPAGVTFVSASDGGAAASGVVSWPLGVLTPGRGGVRDVTVQLDGGLVSGTVIEAVAQMTSAAASLDSSLAEVNTVIGAAGGLQLAIESNVNPARLGELLNMQLIVRNADPFPRFDVSLVGMFPEGFAQLFEAGFAGNCGSSACEAGERVAWSLGEIGAGETAVVDLPAVIANTAADGTLANFYVEASDSQGLQTRQMETLRVRPDTVYDLILAEATDPVVAGSTLDYSLVWGYRDDAAAVAQTVLNMPVPAGTSFVSASDGGVLAGDVVEWQLGFLSPGENGVRSARFTAGGGLTNGSVIEASADMFEVGDTTERLRAEALTSVTPANGLKLAIETNTNAARLNEKSNYRLTVSNTDPFTRFGVQIAGRFPQDIRQLFESEFDGDCGSSACESSEIVTFSIGDIEAGDGKSVDLPATMTNVGADGILANLFVVARDDQGAQVRVADTLRLQSDTVYDVSLNEDSDPAIPGAALTYTLTWGLRDDAASVRDTRLQLALPAGVTLQSASDVFVQDGNVVTWDLGFVSPGAVGVRTATVLIDGGLAAGNVLEASVDLFDAADTDEGAQSEAHTVVRATTPLSLDVDAAVYAALSGRELNTSLTVTNNDAFTRFGVALKARFPRDVAQLFESVANFDGDCGSSACEPDEIVSWPVVDIPAGESVTVQFPAVTANAVVEGSLVNLYAWVEDDQGVQARGTESYPTGCIEEVDSECDGILDVVDNCLGVVNTAQNDGDNDGLGNACDADLNQDCIVNVIDLGIFRTRFFTDDAAADFDGNGVVNVVDLGILRTLFFQPPGPSALDNLCD